MFLHNNYIKHPLIVPYFHPLDRFQTHKKLWVITFEGLCDYSFPKQSRLYPDSILNV